ncbi:hypothetical protein TVAG_381060 [Trichomonas vaginalis G3]|uniref:Uncharacterized protein n=1 Tax=Trichomonas vaginalis (strain ATCC PRA-98 / G3) TaxID=412133 RepID=A2G1G2_TRIV3|nr:uncharacterized protein TVAGG3_1090830 [Trichomonas vaginalis G3]EAX88997.1 hypothetical protein TVAG_381060 [Trichomonas vaginalis G3]KAI5482237.1 hypothetical protein TVAGG3_1090830 [Trichomonas vaginalis G3]|eukprot:XP_001301927.1 hypothetical protein [Trichomonas vaginalis G3]
MILSILMFMKCKDNYQNFNFDRCRLSENETHWMSNSEIFTFGIYLHSKSTSSVELTSSDGKQYSIKPGKCIYIAQQNISAKCSGKDCDITFWFSPVPGDYAYIIADSTGAAYYAKNVRLTTDYLSFIDFGSDSRIEISDLEHPKRYPLTFYTSETNNSDIAEYSTFNLMNGSVVNFSKPGILQLSQAPFDRISFNFIAGSTLKNSKEFSQNGLSVEWENVNYTRHDIYSKISTEFNEMPIKYTMNAITALVFLTSLIYSLIKLRCCQCCNNKPKEESITEASLLV